MNVVRVGGAGARKWWALAGLSLGVLAVGLDATVLSVALPTLAVSLHATATDLQWFVSAYTLALAVALLPGGLLGDRFGRKKVMIGRPQRVRARARWRVRMRRTPVRSSPRGRCSGWLRAA